MAFLRTNLNNRVATWGVSPRLNFYSPVNGSSKGVPSLEMGRRALKNRQFGQAVGILESNLSYSPAAFKQTHFAQLILAQLKLGFHKMSASQEIMDTHILAEWTPENHFERAIELMGFAGMGGTTWVPKEHRFLIAQALHDAARTWLGTIPEDAPVDAPNYTLISLMTLSNGTLADIHVKPDSADLLAEYLIRISDPFSLLLNVMTAGARLGVPGNFLKHIRPAILQRIIAKHPELLKDACRVLRTLEIASGQLPATLYKDTSDPDVDKAPTLTAIDLILSRRVDKKYRAQQRYYAKVLGRLYWLSGNTEKAVLACAEAVASPLSSYGTDPDFYENHLILGELYLAKQTYGKAVHHLELAEVLYESISLPNESEELAPELCLSDGRTISRALAKMSFDSEAFTPWEVHYISAMSDHLETRPPLRLRDAGTGQDSPASTLEMPNLERSGRQRETHLEDIEKFFEAKQLITQSYGLGSWSDESNAGWGIIRDLVERNIMTLDDVEQFVDTLATIYLRDSSTESARFARRIIEKARGEIPNLGGNQLLGRTLAIATLLEKKELNSARRQIESALNRAAAQSGIALKLDSEKPDLSTADPTLVLKTVIDAMADDREKELAEAQTKAEEAERARRQAEEQLRQYQEAEALRIETEHRAEEERVRKEAESAAINHDVHDKLAPVLAELPATLDSSYGKKFEEVVISGVSAVAAAYMDTTESKAAQPAAAIRSWETGFETIKAHLENKGKMTGLHKSLQIIAKELYDLYVKMDDLSSAEKLLTDPLINKEIPNKIKGLLTDLAERRKAAQASDTTPYEVAQLDSAPTLPERDQAQMQTAHALIRTHKPESYKQAMHIYQDLAKRFPQLWQAWFGWGICLLNIDKEEESIKILEQGLRHAPGNIELLETLFAIYLRREAFDEAQRILDRAYEAKPNQIVPKLCQIRLDVERGNVEPAIALLQKTVSTLPDLTPEERAHIAQDIDITLMNACKVLPLIKNYEALTRLCQCALENGFDVPHAHGGIGTSLTASGMNLIKAGKNNEGQAYLEKAGAIFLKLTQDDPTLMYGFQGLARVLKHQGQMDDAWSAYLQATELDGPFSKQDDEFLQFASFYADSLKYQQRADDVIRVLDLYGKNAAKEDARNFMVYYHGMIEALILKGNIDEASALSKTALQSRVLMLPEPLTLKSTASTGLTRPLALKQEGASGPATEEVSISPNLLNPGRHYSQEDLLIIGYRGTIVALAALAAYRGKEYTAAATAFKLAMGHGLSGDPETFAFYIDSLWHGYQNEPDPEKREEQLTEMIQCAAQLIRRSEDHINRIKKINAAGRDYESDHHKNHALLQLNVAVSVIIRILSELPAPKSLPAKKGDASLTTVYELLLEALISALSGGYLGMEKLRDPRDIISKLLADRAQVPSALIPKINLSYWNLARMTQDPELSRQLQEKVFADAETATRDYPEAPHHWNILAFILKNLAQEDPQRIDLWERSLAAHHEAVQIAEEHVADETDRKFVRERAQFGIQSSLDIAKAIMIDLGKTDHYELGLKWFDVYDSHRPGDPEAMHYAIWFALESANFEKAREIQGRLKTLAETTNDLDLQKLAATLLTGIQTTQKTYLQKGTIEINLEKLTLY